MEPLNLTTTLLGRHNAYNVAAASAVLLSCGLPGEQLRAALSQVAQIPGRLERIANDQGAQIVIDYAHTADAIRLLLLSLRELTRGKLILVFGCGGDRDESKRPVMGRMAGLLADAVVLTSDNPRTEAPERILEQIQAGFPPTFSHFQVIADREQAIAAAVNMAHPGDTVVIAGKGHERYQLFNHIAVPFSDHDVVERILSTRQSVALS